MFDLDDLRGIARFSHIAIGFAGLVLLWIPALARKGGRLHVASGRLFTWCAYYVGITGVLASIWGLVHPPFFLPTLHAVTPDEARLSIENLRFILSITGFFGLGVLSGISLGASVMRHGEDHERVKRSGTLLLSLAFTLWSGALAIYGIGTLIAAHLNLHFLDAASVNHYFLTAGLGALGFYGGRGDLAYIRGPRPEPAQRMAMHIECMIGAGAAFYSAFLLFGVTRLFSLPGYWLLAAMIPTVIGAIATKRVIRRLPEVMKRPAGVRGAAS